MIIRLEQFEKNQDTAKPNVIGFARVNIDGTLHVWVTVLTGTKGIFLKVPSIRINNEYQPAITWPGQSVEAKIRESILPEIQKRLNGAPSNNEQMAWM